MKFSPDLKLLQQSEFADSIIGNHSGIVMIRDEVFVCDNVNNCIKVYTKELEYKRQFGSENDGPGVVFLQMTMITCMLVIRDSLVSMYSVVVDGFFSHLVKALYTSVQGGKLKHPIGVFVSGQHVFVVDMNSCIVVYTTDGKCLTSYGGVCVDRDGYVYVCINSKILFYYDYYFLSPIIRIIILR